MRFVVLVTLMALTLGVGGPGAQEKKMTKYPVAVITLAKGGEIRIELYPDTASKTVENFTTLAKKGFYDGLTFHRVVPGFVAQGGDPKGDGTGGEYFSRECAATTCDISDSFVPSPRLAHPDSAG